MYRIPGFGDQPINEIAAIQQTEYGGTRLVFFDGSELINEKADSDDAIKAWLVAQVADSSMPQNEQLREIYDIYKRFAK